MSELRRSPGWRDDDHKRNQELSRMADAFERMAAALEKIAEKPNSAEVEHAHRVARARLGLPG